MMVLSRSRHGGDVRRIARGTGLTVASLLDFSANINPLGPPPWLSSVIAREVDNLVHYPEPEAESLCQAAAKQWQVGCNEIVAGNGVAELLAWLPRSIGAKRALIPCPCYVDYPRCAVQAGLAVQRMVLAEVDDFALDVAQLAEAIQPLDLVFIGRPNNPTGQTPSVSLLCALAEQAPSATVVVDEAFVDFCRPNPGAWEHRPPNVVLLRSMTKFWAIPGLRLGFAIAAPSVASELRRLLPPWSVNSLAQAVGMAALADPSDFAERSRALCTRERARLASGLAALQGLKTYPSEANFLLVRAPHDATQLTAALQQAGLPVRLCDNYDGLDARYFRVAVRRPEDNNRLLETLGGWWQGMQAPRQRADDLGVAVADQTSAASSQATPRSTHSTRSKMTSSCVEPPRPPRPSKLDPAAP